MARAEYDFSAASEEEISLRAGDMLNLAPKGEAFVYRVLIRFETNKMYFLLKLVCFILVAEQQPRVRGWLLASVDGQAIGLVPANYVKVLGKRRGRKHAEMERLAQVQQENQQATQTPAAAQTQSTAALGFTSDPSTASMPASADHLLESAYREIPAGFSMGTSSSDTVLNVPEKTDL